MRLVFGCFLLVSVAVGSIAHAGEHDISTMLLNSRRSLWDKLTGTYYVRASGNGAIYKGSKGPGGHIVIDRYNSKAVGHEEFQRRVPEVGYHAGQGRRWGR